MKDNSLNALAQPATLAAMSASPSVLITGANGFVGARLVREFLSQNFDVIAGVRKNANLQLLAGLPVSYRYGEVTEPSTLAEMVKGVDYVIHNAGLVKAKHESEFFQVNEVGTRNILEAISRNNPTVRKVVCVSSLAAAGPSLDGRGVTESDAPRPITAYGRSKLAAEAVALQYADKLPITIIRPPAVYGPGEKEILTIFKTIDRHVRPMIGNQNRAIQLVHVDDLARGIALASVSDSKSGTILFISESRAYSMQELLDTIQSALGTWAVPIPLPAFLFRLIAMISEGTFKLVGAKPMLTREKASELLAAWKVSTQKAEETIGFSSSIPFDRGAKLTVNWYREMGWL